MCSSVFKSLSKAGLKIYFAFTTFHGQCVGISPI